MPAVADFIEKCYKSKPVQSYFNLIKRFLPDEQAQSGEAAGLDISTGECKLITLNKTKESYELSKWIIEPIHNGDIKASIQNIITQLEAPPSSLYTSIFGKGTLIRYIEMPRMSLDDLKSSFSIEADKYFPFASDQIYTDCFIIDDKEKGRNMSVMAAASKKELVDRRTKLLTDLEIPIEFVGLNPIALANAFNMMGYDSKGEKEGKEGEARESTVALLDVGESVSSLTIFVDKLPRFTRDIFIGGRDFTKSISNAMGISFQDAEKLKKSPGEKKDEMVKACETTMMNMIQELRLSMDYFATEKNKEIERLLLTGGSSMLDGITEGIESNLEVKTGLWNPFANILLGSDVPKENMEKTALKLGVALGLALYQYD